MMNIRGNDALHSVEYAKVTGAITHIHTGKTANLIQSTTH